MSQAPSPLWRSRSLIIIIALTALIPFALAWYYAKHPELIDKTSNYGTLIMPPRSLDFLPLVEGEGAGEKPEESLKGRWVLLQVAKGPCAAVCAETLYKTHQGWLMLNKEMPRVKRLLLLADASQVPNTPAIIQDDALQTASLAPTVMELLTTAIGQPPGEGTVILVDPLGNLVLWYDTGFDPYRMVKDLKHLLKASQIG
ncbi:MAG: hypothetical protein ACKN9W_02760 [Methylococcus sp.]